MAGYVRQSAADIVPTAVVRAAPINNEFNALRDAFAVAGGHKHDGTAAEGHLVPLISDANSRNKVVVDAANNRISVFISVSSAAVEQLRIVDGAVLPVTDNDIDLGSSTLEFKDLWIDGTANIDSLVADTADINAGTIDNTVVGGTTPAAGSFTTLSTTGALTYGGVTLNNAVTGTGDMVLSTSPSLTTPNLGTPSAVTLTNATGLPLTTGVTGTLPVANGGTGITSFGTGVATALGQNVTGSGGIVLATSPTLTTPNLGTPSAVTLTNATGLPVSTGISGLGSGVATFLATPSSANLRSAVTDETGSGALVFATSPSLTTPNLGTPSAVTLTNATGLPLTTGVTGTLPVANGGTGITSFGTGVATALGQNVTGSGGMVLATSPTLTTPTLGAATATSINKVALTAPATGSTLTIADGKTLTANNSLTLAGTDATTMTFPSTSATIARTDAAQTFTGTQTFSGAVVANGNVTLGDASSDTITLTGTVQPGVVISGSSSGDALRITQTGTGNALVVEDSANPDATPFVIDAGGRAVVGGTSTVSSLNITPSLQIQGTSQGAAASLTSAWGALSAQVHIARSAGTTVGDYTALVSGNNIGSIRFAGADGTQFVQAADITAAVDGTPGTNDMPGRLLFSTTADGASSPTERLRIASNGLSTFGSQAATGAALSTTAPAKIYTGTGTYTDSSTAASGTVTHGTINAFDNPAIAASNTTVTYTNASTLYIDGAPTAGTNVTITNPYSLFVNSGTVWFGGNVTGTDPVVQQSDIGTAPNEIPLNQYLGALAYEDTETPALDVGTGITTGTGTICKANGGLMGGVYKMTILIDLTGLNSGGTAGDIIGVNGTALPCYIARLPAMTVMGGRMTCLETPAGGDDDIDLYSAAEGTGVEDQAISALTETEIINAGAQTRGTVTYFSADPAANAYFYLVGQGTANATYTAGRFLIEIFGV